MKKLIILSLATALIATPALGYQQEDLNDWKLNYIHSYLLE